MKKFFFDCIFIIEGLKDSKVRRYYTGVTEAGVIERVGSGQGE